MLIIQDKLISEAVIDTHFLCNLQACKGACCVEGDMGAPLDPTELPVLNAIYEAVSPYMTEAGRAAVAMQGTYVTDHVGDHYTPLIDGGPCAYIQYDEQGIALCAIEMAWKAGAVEFRKPISCHLYPIRVTDNREQGFEALNYHQWEICSPACRLGKTQQLPLYQFLRDALVRKYGPEFYDELDSAAQYLKNRD